MCLVNEVHPSTKVFQRRIQPYDCHGYVRVYKWMREVLKSGVMKWQSPYRYSTVGSGLCRAVGESAYPMMYGFYGCLTYTASFQVMPSHSSCRPALLQCLVKKSWILSMGRDVTSMGRDVNSCYDLRMVRCSHMVFPKWPNKVVTVREFRKICKEEGV